MKLVQRAFLTDEERMAISESIDLAPARLQPEALEELRPHLEALGVRWHEDALPNTEASAFCTRPSFKASCPLAAAADLHGYDPETLLAAREVVLRVRADAIRRMNEPDLFCGDPSPGWCRTIEQQGRTELSRYHNPAAHTLAEALELLGHA